MLTIVYQDRDLIVPDKQPRMTTVPGLSDTINSFDLATRAYPNCRLVHRLDMATPALYWFALNYRTQKSMNRIFEQRKIRKCHTAVVDNIITADSGEIHVPLSRNIAHRPRQKIDWLNGKSSSTFFRTVQRNLRENSTRVLLEPYTGRSQQLRLHMWQIGHPILGDEFYFKNISRTKSTRLMLHTTSIEFIHPVLGENIY